jgi:hypothetical protein
MLLMSLQDRAPPHDSYDHRHYQTQDSYDYERIRTFSACHILETSALDLKVLRFFVLYIIVTN